MLTVVRKFVRTNWLGCDGCSFLSLYPEVFAFRKMSDSSCQAPSAEISGELSPPEDLDTDFIAPFIEEEDRKGLKFDETPDTRKLLHYSSYYEVVNENRVRPRVFYKLGNNTVEEPGGYMSPHGSEEITLETIAMTESIHDVFRNRHPVPPKEEPTRYVPAKFSESEMKYLRASAALAAAASVPPYPDAKEDEDTDMRPAQEVPPPSAFNKFHLLSKSKNEERRKRAPPPRANIRLNFKPLPRR